MSKNVHVNLVVSIDENIEISGEVGVIKFTTIDAGSLVCEVATPKFSLSLEDLELTVSELRKFIDDKRSKQSGNGTKVEQTLTSIQNIMVNEENALQATSNVVEYLEE